MKVLQINSCNFGSTGNIMLGIARMLNEQGHSSVVCVPSQRSNFSRSVDNQWFIGNRITRNLHILFAKLISSDGCFSYLDTRSFIKKIEHYQPDVIQLHNLHGCYINLKMLFRYIKNKNIPIVWTLHDCWSFTGQCPHFILSNCEKWKSECARCNAYKNYPVCAGDRSKIMYRNKKKWFTGVNNLTVVTPSHWLADLAKESLLHGYPIKVIHNGIDLSVFTPSKSDFRVQYNIPRQKKIILGVAFEWGNSKGLDVFIEMSKRLNPNIYQIVLVGTSDVIDKKLPDNIISIHRTTSPKQLAEIYSAADLFVNPTREDNYPTVNMEALACGTPVLTYNTGGSPEILDESCGSVVDVDDYDMLVKETIRLSWLKDDLTDRCCLRSHMFDKQDRYQEYLELYRRIYESVTKNRVGDA